MAYVPDERQIAQVVADQLDLLLMHAVEGGGELAELLRPLFERRRAHYLKRYGLEPKPEERG